MAKVQTLSAEFIDELAWTIEQVKRLVKGSLQDGEPDLRNAPDDVVVMTPSGGIAARSGTTCYSEDCNRYTITDTDRTDGECTLTALVDGSSNPLTVEVFNLSNSAVEGDKYVVTARLKSGHRYVVVESCDAEA
jgi:hypothetical protein